jgi:UDP-N-acetylmuramyl pentapeptide phosphotransferase/UDP-N-acetylglucosamine-1-phosphate transferase
MIAAAPLIGLTLTLILTPYIAARMKKAGIVGRDIHKVNQPEVAEMGGLAVLLSLPVALAPFVSGEIARILMVFLLFGVSVGSLGFLRAFAPYHGYFSAAAVLLVGYLWFDWWRGRKDRIACATSLCKNYTLYLSLGTLFVALLASYPWWMGWILMEA